jgi:N-acetylmuramoyl-L-alanine amidase-like protein/Big-like domain-containing protein
MGSRRIQAVLAVLLVGTVGGVSGARGSPLRVLIAHTPNKTSTNRTAKTIDAIVIHDTEGRFLGSVRTLQNPRVDGSAHFVVSRDGQIVQLVPVTDVAWHAGNSWWNLHSIGIEHEGWAGRRAYTMREYRASAQLVAYLAHRWGIPLDRRHIIGHDEVPDPNRHGEFGGASHHTDPGRAWNWGLYMSLVRYYATHRVLPTFVKRMTLHDSPLPASLLRAPSPPVRSVVDYHATVHGKALWWSGIDSWHQAIHRIWQVEFRVDGKLLYTDHTWPYSFHRTAGWDSSTVANGRHMLSVRAYGAHHYRTLKRVPVRVANPPLHVRITGAVSGGAVYGLLTLTARISGHVDRVTLYADGRPVSRDALPPYTLDWDTRSATEGDHRLLVYARDRHGHRAALAVPVVVANAPTFPAALTQNWVTHHIEPVGDFADG